MSTNLLHVNPEKLGGIEQALDPDGPGVFYIPEAVPPEALACIQDEIFDPFKVQWRDNHHRSSHPRHGELIENHDVLALKLDRGDHRWEYRVPRMQQLCVETVQFIRSLGAVFPSLFDYTPDEMSLHRYDDAEVGLSFHVDNERFRKLVAVVRLEGENEFQYLSKPHQKGDVITPQNIHVIAAKAGDLILTRVPGLHELKWREDAPNRVVNDCPDHRVVNQKTPHATSFMIRENSVPHLNPNGFTYENWSDDDD